MLCLSNRNVYRLVGSSIMEVASWWSRNVARSAGKRLTEAPMTNDLRNPWPSVPSQPPHVLQCDRDSVAEYNTKCRKEDYRLQTDALPEPLSAV